MHGLERLCWVGPQKLLLMSTLVFFLGNIFICNKSQSDSPVGPEETENEADWFISASVMYKIGESASIPSA